MNDLHDILSPVVLSDMLVGVPAEPTVADIAAESRGAGEAEAAFVNAVLTRESINARTVVAIARHRESEGALSLRALPAALTEAGVEPLFGASWNATSIRRAHLVGLVVDDRPVIVREVLTALGTANPSGAIKAVLAAEPGERFEALLAYVKAEAQADEPQDDEVDGEGDGEGEGADEAESTTTDADIANAIANALKGWSNDGSVDPAAFVAAVAAAVGVTALAAAA